MSVCVSVRVRACACVCVWFLVCDASECARVCVSVPTVVLEVVLQVVHDLAGVTDDLVAVHQHRHLPGRVEPHEPGLVVLTEGQAHVVLLAEQALLRYGQTHLQPTETQGPAGVQCPTTEG